MRAMLLEFPDDPTCDYLDRQYMLGEALLVAPIFRPDGVVDYYLPAGRWTNFLTGTVVEGGRWLRETHDYMSLPLMVRPNTVIPVGANEQRPDYDYAEGVTFHVFELADGATHEVRVPGAEDGAALTATVRREGPRIHVDVPGATKPWRVLLHGIAAPQSVEGATVQAGALGTLLIPEHDAGRLSVRLSQA
jgi:alpha-D-xyloside xylohydrolase